MSSFKGTGISYLVRRSCGNYYWQARLGGASRRGSLKTKKLSTAKARLPIALSQARKKWEGGDSEKGDDLVTVGDWLREWRRRQMARPSLKQATKDHDGKLVRLLLEEDWIRHDIQKVPTREIGDWWARFCGRCAPDTVNARLRVLKAAMRLALDEGATRDDPTRGLERAKKKATVKDLPPIEDLDRLIESIRGQGRRFSDQCAAMVAFAAFSGMRPKEVASVRCEDIRDSFVVVRGGSTGTKNRREREVPMIPRMRALVEQEGWMGRTGPVFTIKTPARAMGRACARLGIPHLTPYDLRHFFVTMCIEAGIDVPTVALWAGHQDGGALIMSTYTHVRRRHSIQEAARVVI